ncbi:MAG: hypothetical protein OXG78_01715 [Chloroflexi bacterium]|nr:hypothetical protein [Chloroflexota bacterium]
MKKSAIRILFALGLVVALLGIAVDYVLPGASPGVSLPQLLVVVAGLALVILSLKLRRAKAMRLGSGKRGRLLFSAALITAATLVILELVLWLVGWTPYFKTEPPNHRLVEGGWHTCDEAGCHFVYDEVAPACEAGVLYGRVCEVINRQGYSDADDFTWDDDYENRTRVLLLGDSFTFGRSADVGKSFAEFLDAENPDAVIWNTGITGNGTHSAIAAFNVYGQILKPQLTVLGFFKNDFNDNLVPMDSWVRAIGPDGKGLLVRLHRVDDQENVIAYDVEDIEYLRSFWHLPPDNELQRLLGSTRLSSLLLRLIDVLTPEIPADKYFDRREQVTRQYLRELRDTVAAQGSALLVLLIPGLEDIGDPGMRYQLTRDILNSLEIAYLDPIDRLENLADYATPPDDHWSNSGHQKVGALLSKCVAVFIEGGGLTECEDIVIPLRE